MLNLDKVDIVFGDDCQAMYVDGELQVSATRLTFADIIEHLASLRADFWEADLDVYKDPRAFPKSFKDIVYPGENPFEEQQQEQAQ